MARPVCILTACRRLGGQLLLPAPFPHPRVSPESPESANSHCLVISRSSRTKPVLSFKSLLKMTGCICETCQVEDDEEEGEKRHVSKTGKNIESGFHGWVDDGKSWINL